MVYWVLILVVFICLLYRFVNRTLNYWKNQEVRGPEPVPLFGNLKDSALRRTPAQNIFYNIYNEFKNEKVVGVYRMTTPCLFIRDPDIIRDVLIKDFNAFIDRGQEFDTDGLGKNLFHADGGTWQVLRNKFTPLFTTGKLKDMLHLIKERGDKFIEYVDDVCKQNPEQEVHSLVRKYTVSVIAACAFGLDINVDDETMKEVARITKLRLKLNHSNELDMMFPGILKRFSNLRMPRQVKDFFYKLVQTVVKQRNGLPTNRNDFMDLLLDMKNKKKVTGMKRSQDEIISVEINENLMAAQAFIFFGAGYNPSATTMTFLLYELAKNPKVQDKLIAEIDDVLSKFNGEVSYDALMELKYMSKVFDETLRLYPLVDLLRNANRKYNISGTDVVLNKYQTVLISPFSLHRDEKYYPDPEKFDPERFSPENSKNRHPCVYLPFGVGPRHCIGMRFAKIQSRVGLLKLLSKYRVQLSENSPKVLEMDPFVRTMCPKGGIRLNVVPRKKL